MFALIFFFFKNHKQVYWEKNMWSGIFFAIQVLCVQDQGAAQEVAQRWTDFASGTCREETSVERAAKGSEKVPANYIDGMKLHKFNLRKNTVAYNIWYIKYIISYMYNTNSRQAFSAHSSDFHLDLLLIC